MSLSTIIKNNIPKEKEVNDNDSDAIISYKMAYNITLQDLHASIPKIVEEVLKEIEDLKNSRILGTEESNRTYKFKTEGYHKAIKDIINKLK